MMNTACQSPVLENYAETIRALHLIDKKNRGQRTRRAVVLGALVVALGGAAFRETAPASGERFSFDEPTVALR